MHPLAHPKATGSASVNDHGTTAYGSGMLESDGKTNSLLFWRYPLCPNDSNTKGIP